MVWFTVKKAFFDFWDNLFKTIILNLGYIFLLSIPVFLPYWLYGIHVSASIAAFAAGVLLIFVYTGAASLVARDISDYGNPGFREFFGYLKESWGTSIIFGLIVIAHMGILMVAFPVYAAMKNLFGIAAMVFIFWFSVIWALSCQYYFPIRSRIDRNPLKIVKKCFLLFFDNTAFTIFLAFGTVVILVLSSFTAFLLPGFAAVLIWLQAGFKLRLLKYDHFEKNPEADRGKIPWDALLVEEEERVGKRTLKGMIFPWKE